MAASTAVIGGASALGSAVLLRTAVFAANAHADQRRKNAAQSPYIVHPLSVAAAIANEGGVDDTATLQAALL
jgi:(p)ppGpp synthase/HD superfamily hydrolase